MLAMASKLLRTMAMIRLWVIGFKVVKE